jgi:hypothetical protein
MLNICIEPVIAKHNKNSTEMNFTPDITTRRLKE